MSDTKEKKEDKKIKIKIVEIATNQEDRPLSGRKESNDKDKNKTK